MENFIDIEYKRKEKVLVSKITKANNASKSNNLTLAQKLIIKKEVSDLKSQLTNHRLNRFV